jgi:hypothetical protein
MLISSNWKGELKVFEYAIRPSSMIRSIWRESHRDETE